MKIRLFLFILFVLSSGPTMGQEPTSKSKTTYDKKTRLDFEEKSVDGQFQRPDSQQVDADKNLNFNSLMEPRSNFKKELKRSLGSVR